MNVQSLCKCGKPKSKSATECFSCSCGGGKCVQCGKVKRGKKLLCRKCYEETLKPLQRCKCGNKKTQYADLCQSCKSRCSCGNAKTVKAARCRRCCSRENCTQCAFCNKSFTCDGALKYRKTCSDECRAALTRQLAIKAARKAGNVNKEQGSLRKAVRYLVIAEKKASQVGCCVVCGVVHKIGRSHLCTNCKANVTSMAKRLDKKKTCTICGCIYDNRTSQSPKYCSKQCRLFSYSNSLKSIEAEKVAKFNRRHRIRCNQGQMVERVIPNRIYKRDKQVCVYCGTRVRRYESNGWLASDEATLDHVIPISLGGGHTESNVVTACRDCNVKKGATFYVDDELANQYSVVDEKKNKNWAENG